MTEIDEPEREAIRPRPVLKALPASQLSRDAFISNYERLFVGAFLLDDRARPKLLFVSTRQQKEFALANLAHFSTIEDLNLSDVAVNGEELALFGRLPNLESIEFDSCRLTGDSGWSEIKNVNEIQFGSLNLNVDLLAAVARAPYPQKITFDDCRIESFAPLAEMTQLRHLNFIGKNQIAQPKSLFSLQQITDLEFMMASFAEYNVADLAMLPNLGGLKLSGGFRGRTLDRSELADLKKLEKLKRLAIYNQPAADGSFLADVPIGLMEFRFTGSILPLYQGDLSRFHQLRVLELNDRKFGAEAIAKIANNCSRLQSIKLMNFEADVSAIVAIGELKNLERLVINDGFFLDSPTKSVRHEPGLLAGLQGLDKLKVLTIDGGYKIDRSDAMALGSLLALEELSIQRVNLGSGAFEALGNLQNLTQLDLRYCNRLKGEHVQAISKLTGLERLDMANVRGRNLGLGALKTLAKLRVLDLGGIGSISNSDLEFAAGTRQLEKLTLGSCAKVDDEGLALLGQAPRLVELSLSKMEIDGSGFASWPTGHPLRQLDAQAVYLRQAGLDALSKFEQLEMILSRIILISDKAEIADLRCFENSKRLKVLALEGSYIINKEFYEQLHAKRPELDVSFHRFDR